MRKINLIGFAREINVWVIFLLLIVQVGCSPHKSTQVVSIERAPSHEVASGTMLRTEPRSRYGNPSSYFVFGKRYQTLLSSHNFSERGIASWYGEKFHGKRTSSGETYDMYAMTAAHTRLPLPTYVQVTNLKNGKQVTVRVNDRGPFHDNRVIDLSYSAAAKLDMVEEGTSLVEVRAINPLNYRTAQTSGQANEINEIAAVEPGDAAPAIEADPRVFVQVGAFGNRENANQLLSQLNGLNLGAVTISSMTQDAQKLHCVRIGPLPTVQSVDDAVVKLSAIGLNEHRVVIE